MRWGWLLLVMSLLDGRALGQATCPIYDRTTLNALTGLCASARLGEPCGYPVDNLSTYGISYTGEVGSAAPLVQINTEAFTPEDFSTVPTTLLVAGAVDLIRQDTTEPLVLYDVDASEGVNVRRRPQPDATILFAALQGQVLRVVGRLADTSWVQVISGGGRAGWATGSAFSEELSDLPVIEPDAPIVAQQAFLPYTDLTLQPGQGQVCSPDVPTGLLIQTQPQDEPTRAMLRVNNTFVMLDGTVFVSVTTSDTALLTTFALLEGEVTLIQDNVRLRMTPASTLTTRSEGDTTTFTSEVSRPYDYLVYTALPVPLLPRPFYVPVPDLTEFLTPRPREDVSPLRTLLATDPCRITTGEGGSNLRAGAGTEFPVMSVMGFRESASVLGKALGSDGQNWWNIGPYLWVSGLTTVTGGDCFSVPELPVEARR